jgi:hypothetical protein
VAVRPAATAYVTRIPIEAASRVAVAVSPGRAANANTAPIAAAAVIRPRLRARLSMPEISPRRSAGTLVITEVVLAAWKSASLPVVTVVGTM